MRVVACLFLLTFLSDSFQPATAVQEEIPQRDTRLGEYADRYGVESWPGKYGSVVAGLSLEDLSTDDTPLVMDHERWLDVDGEKVVNRQYVTADKLVILEVAVARSSRTAHWLLFDFLTSSRTVKPLEPPALPFGRVRLDGIGDVCFALPQRGQEEFHSIEFVRYNIVVRIRSKGGESTGLRGFAEAVDRTILSRPLYRDWQESKLWPSIDRFEASSNQLKVRSIVPLLISITEPRDEHFTMTWEMSAGGILEEKGSVYYYAEGSGPQTLTLLVANRSGLADAARIELQVSE